MSLEEGTYASGKTRKSYKTIFTNRYAGKVLSNTALQWSNDNYLILSLFDEISISKFKLYGDIVHLPIAAEVYQIPKSSEVHDFDVHVTRSNMVQKLPLGKQVELMYDRTISPCSQSTQNIEGYASSTMFPNTSQSGKLYGNRSRNFFNRAKDVQGNKGLKKVCDSGIVNKIATTENTVKACYKEKNILASLTFDNQLCLFSRSSSCKNYNESIGKWKKIVNLSHVYYKKMVADGFSMCDTQEHPNCPVNSKMGSTNNSDDAGTVDQFNLLKSRCYALAPVLLAWNVEAYYDKSSDVEFVLLAVAMKNRTIIIWKVMLPLEDELGVHIHQVMSVVGVISSICWVPVESQSVLMLGGVSGTISYCVVESETKQVSAEEVVWSEEDDVTVHCFAKNADGPICICGKGIYLFMFCLDVNEDGHVDFSRLSHSITSSQLFVSSACGLSESQFIVQYAEGQVVEVKCELCDDGIRLKVVEKLDLGLMNGINMRANGLAMSPNRVVATILRTPSSYFCHLAERCPIELKMLTKLSVDDCFKLLLDNPSASDHIVHYYDVLLAFRCQILEESWKLCSQFSDLLDNIEEWKSHSCYLLQLALFLLQLLNLKWKTECNHQSEGELNSNSAKISLAKHLLVCRHAERSVGSVDISETWGDLCAVERSILEGARAFLKVAANGSSSQPVDLPSTCHEFICPVCGEMLSLRCQETFCCRDGHGFKMCSRSFLPMVAPVTERCKYCSRLYSCLPSAVSGPLLRALCDADCLFCGGLII